MLSFSDPVVVAGLILFCLGAKSLKGSGVRLLSRRDTGRYTDWRRAQSTFVKNSNGVQIESMVEIEIAINLQIVVPSWFSAVTVHGL